MLAKGGLIATLVFSFRLVEGSDAGQLSIWTGPLRRLPAKPQTTEAHGL